MVISRTSEALPAFEPTSKGEAPPAAAPVHGSGQGDFARLLHGLGRELDRGEALAERAVHGGASLSPDALLALQAGIYRYSEAVDLVSKLVDRGAQAVKATLQNQ
jgi:hypothetical protein